MRETITACNLCRSRIEPGGGFGLIADDYGKYNEEYRSCEIEATNIHLCRECEKKLMVMFGDKSMKAAV